jgi:chaperonin GroEL
MLQTTVKFKENARDLLVAGATKLAQAVGCTMGAEGKLVGYSRASVSQNGELYSPPMRVTKDGVTVARYFELSDPNESKGAAFIREAAERTAYIVGDATTATTVLASAILERANKTIANKDINVRELKDGINLGVQHVIAEVSKMSTQIGDDMSKARNIATVSANNDAILGGLIGDIYEKVGADVDIKIEDARGGKTAVEIVEGFRLNIGYVSPYFSTDKHKMISELNKPLILFYENAISKSKEIIPLLDKVTAANRELLIFSENLEDEAFSFLSHNTLKGNIRVCAVQAPFHSEMRVQNMLDMALLTGGTFINGASGIRLEDVMLDDLGTCDKAIIGRYTTEIIGGGKDNREKALKKAKGLKELMLVEKDEQTLQNLKDRYSRLTSSVAMLYIGGATASESSEIKDRADDAVRATKAAIEEGYVAGGGTAFLKVKSFPVGKTTSENEGIKIVAEAIKTPLFKICENASVEPLGIIKQVSQSEDVNVGYNVVTRQLEDLVASGIIDPIKALRHSLINAASAACNILYIDCTIIDETKDN